MLHEVRGRRTETRFPVSINPLTEITIFGGSVGREKSDTSASESQRGGRVICRKDRSWRVSVKGRAAGGRERDRESKNGGGGPRARRGKHGVVPRPPRDPSTLNDRSIRLSISRDADRYTSFSTRNGAAQRRRRETANDSEDRSPNREGR